MKKSAILCALAAAAMGALSVFANINDTDNDFNTCSMARDFANTPVSGMPFSTENVVEEFEDGAARIVLYTDPDAELKECEIHLCTRSYETIVEAIAGGVELTGTLEVIDTVDGQTYYEFVVEEN